MKEEFDIQQKVGKENPFQVPEGYFDRLTDEVMNRLPEKQLPPVLFPASPWQRIRPWLYMAAMLAGAAFIIRVASDNPKPDVAEPSMTIDEAEADMQYIATAIDNTMLDDYALYVYLQDEGE